MFASRSIIGGRRTWKSGFFTARPKSQARPKFRVCPNSQACPERDVLLTARPETTPSPRRGWAWEPRAFGLRRRDGRPGDAG